MGKTAETNELKKIIVGRRQKAVGRREKAEGRREKGKSRRQKGKDDGASGIQGFKSLPISV